MVLVDYEGCRGARHTGDFGGSRYQGWGNIQLRHVADVASRGRRGVALPPDGNAVVMSDPSGLVRTLGRALHDRGASTGDEEIKGAVPGRLPYYSVW